MNVENHMVQDSSHAPWNDNDEDIIVGYACEWCGNLYDDIGFQTLEKWCNKIENKDCDECQKSDDYKAYHTSIIAEKIRNHINSTNHSDDSILVGHVNLLNNILNYGNKNALEKSI